MVLYDHACMYACMHLCVHGMAWHVRMHVCMHVCFRSCMDVRAYAKGQKMTYKPCSTQPKDT